MNRSHSGGPQQDFNDGNSPQLSGGPAPAKKADRVPKLCQRQIPLIASRMLVLSVLAIGLWATTNTSQAGSPTGPADKVYWATRFDGIFRSEEDGTGVALVSPIDFPRFVAVDPTDGKIYYTNDSSTADIVDGVRRANSDGTGIEDLSSESGAWDIAVDPSGGKVYWTNRNTNTIRRADLDGSNPQTVIAGGRADGIAIDSSAGKIYYAMPIANSVRRANLDGTGIEVLASIPSTRAIALDLGAGKVYFNSGGTVHRSNLDGSALETVFFVPQSIQDMDVDSAAGKLYWSSTGSGSAVWRSNLDGSGQEELVNQGGSYQSVALDLTAGKMFYVNSGTLIGRTNLNGSGDEHVIEARDPRFIAVEPESEKIYWTHDGGTPVLSGIRRSNLDGTNIEDLRIEIGNHKGIAVDAGAGKMYWADTYFTTEAIKRANLDGSGVQTLVSGLSDPQGVALDLVAGKVYWTDKFTSLIQRSNLNGSGVETALSLPGSGNSSIGPVGLALDVAAGKMYWTHDYAPGGVSRANLDGTNLEELAPTGQSTPKGLALDLESGKMYWSDDSNSKKRIMRANLDGTEFEVILTNVTALGLALLPQGIVTRWTGNGDGSSWSDPANWDPSVVPDETRIAEIGADGTYTVQLASSTSLLGLRLGGGTGVQTLEVPSGVTLTLNGPSTNQGSLLLSGGVLDLNDQLNDQLDIGALGELLSDQGSITGTGGIANRGTVTAFGGGTSTFGVTLDNLNDQFGSGVVQLNDQLTELALNDQLNNDGQVSLAPGTTLNLNDQLNDQLTNNTLGELLSDQAAITGTGGIANRGTITALGGGTSTFGVPIDNLNDQLGSGLVQLNDQVTELALNDQLNNDGTVSLSPGTTLNLNDQLNDQLTNNTLGELLSDQAAITGTGGIANRGTITAVGGGTSTFGVAIDNLNDQFGSGVLQLNDQLTELALNDQLNNDGQVSLAPGTTLNLNDQLNDQLNIGTLGELLSDQAAITGTGGIANRGTITALGGGTSTFGVPIDNLNDQFGSGVVQLNDQITELALNDQLNNDGTVSLSPGTTLNLNDQLNDQLTNNSLGELLSDQAAITGTGGIANRGTITALGGGASTFGVPIDNLNDQFGSGVVQLNDQLTELALNDQLNNDGTISLAPGTILGLNDQLNDQLNIGALGTLLSDQASIIGTGGIANLGTITAMGGGTTTIDVGVANLSDQVNSGSVQLSDQFTELGLNDQFTSAGQVTLNDQTTLRSTGAVDLAFGSLVQGAGTVDFSGASSVSNSARWRPSGSSGFNGSADPDAFAGSGQAAFASSPARSAGGGGTGVLHYIGAFSPAPDAILEITVAGIVPGTDHGQLDVQGDFSPIGQLEVIVEPGFDPQVGNQFDVVVSTGSPGGDFDCLVGLEATNGVFLDPSATATVYSLIATITPGNSPPVAMADADTTTWVDSITLFPLDNDTDPDGDDLRLVGLDTSGILGVATIDPGDSTITYQGPPWLVGEETFTYQISDCQGYVREGLITVELECHGGLTVRVPEDFSTIQAAVDVACSTDTVLIAAGNYSGPGNVQIDPAGVDVVILALGGAAGTVIDCEGAGPAFILQTGESNATVIDGFAIRNAAAGASAGAITIQNASPTIRNCLITGSHSINGGALHVNGGAPTLANSTITANFASNTGGGIYLSGGATLDVLESIVSGNCSGMGGSEIWSDAGVSFTCSLIDSSGVDGPVSYLVDNEFADPEFCDPVSCLLAPTTAGTFTLASSSPALPANNACGQLVGALGEECASPPPPPPDVLNESAKLLASDGSADAHLGRPVEISADHAIAGADENVIGNGAAYVFERQGSVWSEASKLSASDGQPADNFGTGVSISGDYAIVGANAEDGGVGDPLSSVGAAYVFERDEFGSWNEVAKLLASDAEAGDQFGIKVSLDGSYAIVGARLEDGGPGSPLNQAGAAYVFERDQFGSWNEVVKLTASDAQAQDEFGFNVAISRDKAVVGAIGEAGGPGDPRPDAGAAYVFERDEFGNWNEVARLLASDAQAGDEFGFEVDISADRLVVGARFEDGGAGDPLADAGAAYVFERDEFGDWNEVTKLTALDAQAGDRFGVAVSIDGPSVAVGAQSEDGGPGDLVPDAGAVYLFQHFSNGEWSTFSKLAASDAQPGDDFGRGVSISRGRVMAGAPREDGGGGDPTPDVGAVYFLDLLLTTAVDDGGLDDGVETTTTSPGLTYSYPNPFQGSTTIGFRLSRSERVTLTVHDVSGRRVRTLVAGDRHDAGFHTVGWDGRDQAGRALASGIYFYRLETDAFVESRWMTLLK